MINLGHPNVITSRVDFVSNDEIPQTATPRNSVQEEKSPRRSQQEFTLSHPNIDSSKNSTSKQNSPVQHPNIELGRDSRRFSTQSKLSEASKASRRASHSLSSSRRNSKNENEAPTKKDFLCTKCKENQCSVRRVSSRRPATVNYPVTPVESSSDEIQEHEISRIDDLYEASKEKVYCKSCHSMRGEHDHWSSLQNKQVFRKFTKEMIFYGRFKIR